MFVSLLWNNPVYYLSWVLTAAFSICVHEYGHAYAANRLGDTTPALQGRLTLNPLVQMGGRSLLFLFLIGIAWGSVPIDPSQLGDKYRCALVSLAGPLANLLLALVFGLLTVLSAMFSLGETLIQFCTVAVSVNGILFVFNMLPIPILDGFSIVGAFNPRLEELGMRNAQTIFWVFIMLIWFTPLSGIIFSLGNFLSGLVINLWYSAASLLLAG